MAQRLAITLQKGGVGKSTLTINLGGAFAATGARVLLIDFDPQGHLTEGIGLQERYLSESYSLYDKLLEDDRQRLTQPQQQVTSDRFPTHELILQAPNDKFFVIPAHYKMMLAEQDLYRARGREEKLRKVVNEIEHQFDWILIDCPPSLGALTDNALNAARQVVIPVQAEITSVRALNLLLDQIESIERGLNIDINIVAVVPNLVQQSGLSEQILAQLQQAVPYVTPIQFKKRVVLQYAWQSGNSIFSYEPADRNQAAVKNELISEYSQLASLISDRLNETHHE